MDNITVEVGSGDLYVAEDGDDMQLVVITSDGEVAPVIQVVDEPLPADPIPSEIAGPAFSPDGTRLYFSSQRGGTDQRGITYEVTGPFRGARPPEKPTIRRRGRRARRRRRGFPDRPRRWGRDRGGSRSRSGHVAPPIAGAPRTRSMSPTSIASEHLRFQRSKRRPLEASAFPGVVCAPPRRRAGRASQRSKRRPLASARDSADVPAGRRSRPELRRPPPAPARSSPPPSRPRPPSALQISHGTTVVALRYADGVVMAGDRRATAGNLISHRAMEKVFPADRHSGVAIAGAAGPAIEMVKLFQLQLEHYEKVEGAAAQPRGQGQPARARWSATTCRRPCRASPSCRCSPGYDLRRQTGRLFQYDVTGGRYEESDFAATGSGSLHAGTVVKLGYGRARTATAAIDLAITALFQAADEDSATGGPDLVRGIYPTMATITAAGFERVADDEIAERFRALVERISLPHGDIEAHPAAASREVTPR